MVVQFFGMNWCWDEVMFKGVYWQQWGYFDYIVKVIMEYIVGEFGIGGGFIGNVLDILAFFQIKLQEREVDVGKVGIFIKRCYYNIWLIIGFFYLFDGFQFNYCLVYEDMIEDVV